MNYFILFSAVNDKLIPQKINLRFVMVQTGASRCSKAKISSPETMLLLKFRHSIYDSLKALAKISMSSIMIRLFDKSKSRIDPRLITSLSTNAD